jgi:hypothetical protein
VNNYGASLAYFQVQPEGEKLSEQNFLPRRLDFAAGESLTRERYIQEDKNAFTSLLKLIVADLLAQGRTLDPGTNEELLRLIPVLCAYFSRQELTQLVGEKVTTEMLELHRMEVLQNLVLESELQYVLHAFNQAQIPPLLLKGPALAYTIYPEAHLRTYHDIDVLIRPADLPRAHALLLQMGYTFYEEYRANATDNTRTGYNYSIARFDSQFEVVVELHTAPHPSEIGTHFPVESIWEKARPIEVLGESTLTMNSIDHLLYLCWHYRFHGFTRLLWLYDLVVMLRAVGPELDWLELVQVARSQRLATTLYYCLSWCRDLFGAAVPAAIFAQLRPPWGCRLVIERIAMPNTEEALSVARWQSRRIIAHRAMVDSVSALINAGLQAFFPSPASIGRRYMGNSRLPLKFYFVYYFLHPWVTIAKGFRYLLQHRGKRGWSKM